VEDADAVVRLSGWVHRKRDHGGVIFIDLRDRYGLTQVVVNPDRDCFGEAEKVRNESVVIITGNTTPLAGKNPPSKTHIIRTYRDFCQ